MRLKDWCKSKFGNFKVFKDECLARIKAVDVREEGHNLSSDERNLRDRLTRFST